MLSSGDLYIGIAHCHGIIRSILHSYFDGGGDHVQYSHVDLVVLSHRTWQSIENVHGFPEIHG